MARNPLTPFRSGGGLLGGGGDPFMSLHREMNRLFDDVFRGMPAAGGAQGGTGQFIQAQMNVSETDKEIRITAELPGVDQNDVDVSLDDDVLTIREKFEQKEEGELPLRGAVLQHVPALGSPALPGGPGAGKRELRERSAHGEPAEDGSAGASRRSRSRAPRTPRRPVHPEPGHPAPARFRRCRSREVARRKHLRRRIGKFAQPERPLTPPARDVPRYRRGARRRRRRAS